MWENTHRSRLRIQIVMDRQRFLIWRFDTGESTLGSFRPRILWHAETRNDEHVLLATECESGLTLYAIVTCLLVLVVLVASLILIVCP